MCHGRCYNDYLTSQYIGRNSYYTCHDQCISLQQAHSSFICHGVNFCDRDEEICGEDLRCFSGVLKQNISSVPARSYCYDTIDRNVNDHAYDFIDRIDENISQIQDTAYRPNINYTALTTCNGEDIDGRPTPGLRCDSSCEYIGFWCRGYGHWYCDEQGVSINDPSLCSNHTFWKNISCGVTLPNNNFLEGKTCRGKSQNCVWPELPEIYDLLEYPRTCSDFSDRVFEVEQPCPDSPENICWDSCDNPGVNCSACTDPSYFQCPQSKQCVHPQLRCDGHPQCLFGEDEDLDECWKIYHEDKVIMPYATFRCKSIMYPTMEIYAIACDDFPECDDYTDEKFCSDEYVSSTLFISSVFAIAIIYLVLRYWRLLFQRKSFQSKVVTEIYEIKNILKKYSEEHKNEETLKKLNCFLLHTIMSEPLAETEAICSEVYAILEKIFKNDKREIFSCLHQDFDPLIMQNVVDSQFPGILKKITNKIEGTVKYPFITKFSDLMVVNERISTFKSTITRLIKIEFEYLDILKDTILAITIYKIIGAFPAIFDFPTNFSVVVDLCLFATVIIPLFFATLHLEIHNPYMIFNLGQSFTVKKAWKKTLMSLTCCLLSFLNPILLINAYEASKEKFKNMAKSLDENMILQLRYAKKIKYQWASFVNIELGKNLVNVASNLIVHYRLGGLLSSGRSDYPPPVCYNKN